MFKVGGVPSSEYEFWVVRLFFVMAVADGLRGVDGLYDTFEVPPSGFAGLGFSF